MKKVLLATTALVATAGFAAADISLSGSANMGLYYKENGGAGTNDSDTIVKNEIDFGISASGTSDSGISFGASIDLDAAHSDGTSTTDVTNDPEVYVSVNGLKVTVGSLDPTTDADNVADVGFDGIGADDLVSGAHGSANVTVSYSVAGITIAAGMGSDAEDTSVMISGDLQGVSFGLGTAHDESANSDATIVTVGYSMGAFGVGATMVNIDNPAGTADVDKYGVSATYTSGAMKVTVAMSDSDAANQDSNYGVGISYDLGGGLAIAAGYGQLGATTAGGSSTAVADLGLTMSF